MPRVLVNFPPIFRFNNWLNQPASVMTAVTVLRTVADGLDRACACECTGPWQGRCPQLHMVYAFMPRAAFSLRSLLYGDSDPAITLETMVKRIRAAHDGLMLFVPASLSDQQRGALRHERTRLLGTVLRYKWSVDDRLYESVIAVFPLAEWGTADRYYHRQLQVRMGTSVPQRTHVGSADRPRSPNSYDQQGRPYFDPQLAEYEAEQSRRAEDVAELARGFGDDPPSPIRSPPSSPNRDGEEDGGEEVHPTPPPPPPIARAVYSPMRRPKRAVNFVYTTPNKKRQK